MTAINAQEQERFVNEMTRYVKTHKDWKNLQPEAAVRAALWVLVSDKTAFDDLCSVWRADEPPVEETCPDCGYWLGGLVCLALCELSDSGRTASARCASCGFVQDELNWCQRCGHRTVWARDDGSEVSP